MKSSIFSFILCITFLMSVTTVQGQNTIARFKYADAEKAFTNKNYRQCITLLNETEALLGKPAPNVTHLRILATNEQLKTQLPETFENMQKFFADVDFYLANYDIEGLEDKYRQVYDIEKNINFMREALSDEGGFYLTKAFRATTDADTFKWCQKAADLGHAGAQGLLAEGYKTGKLITKEITKDDKKAFEWYSKAAEGGSFKGQYELALLYFNGTGTAQNFEEAHKWFMKTIETTTTQTDAFGASFYLMVSQYYLGRLYEYGQGVTPDYSKAFAWYQKAAEGDFLKAQAKLAQLYATGRGVTRDLGKAFEWYLKAAEAGDVYAQVAVAVYYEKGIGVTQSKAEAIKWYVKAAEGNAASNFYAKRRFADAYYSGEGIGKNYAEALKLYLQVYAKLEDHELRMAIGNIYADGGYGITRDSEEAITWFKQVAAPHEDGTVGILYSEAAYKIAIAYEQQQKYTEAIEWYQKTDGSYTYAKFKIGLMYYEGKMGKPDFEKAREWIEQSRWATADVAMAVMYLHGKSVQKNKDKSVDLWKSSANSKIPNYTSSALFYKMIQEEGEYGRNYPNFAEDARDFFAFLEKDHSDLLK